MSGNDYLSSVTATLATGEATEHFFRPALKSLLEACAPGAVATNEPRRRACGAPDFIVTRGRTPLGYVETKPPGANLDAAENGEQMRRYRDGLGNVVLTDYVEFRWYVGGERRLVERLGVIEKGAIRRERPDAAERVSNLLAALLANPASTVETSEDLAVRMAAVARLICAVLERALNDESPDDPASQLRAQFDGFREVLLPDLTPEQFADMHSQTLCYGLFAARCNVAPGAEFTRERAAFLLPKTNPFLRRLFGEMAGPDLDERISWAIDDLVALLNRANIAAILQDFGRRTRREDPVVHFYETFLAAYDPRLRERRGVYYTPEPVVSYMVRSVDLILKEDFGIRDGLASSERTVEAATAHPDPEPAPHRVFILDPAVGTGTFLHAVIAHIHETRRANPGLWSGYVRDHLLPRLFGFELLMAPYAIAHMKLGLQLTETGYDFQSGERLRIYATNTLEESFLSAAKLPFTQWLVEEANAAARVKRRHPVMVILGNSPYSGHSANAGQWIANLLRGRATQADARTGEVSTVQTESYFMVDGAPLGERNPKWLNDDYVKFLRFAQWRIERTGYGVVAFITNHGYLDNPTFRGMRRSLMETFDDIYVLDLHGNAKKRERAPDGGKDENVFDIQQGVAIGIFVKRGGEKAASKPATVRHAHLWGVRERHEKGDDGERRLVAGKYRWLETHDVRTTKWTKLKPQKPSYLFIPQDAKLFPEYKRAHAVSDIFPVYSSTVTTARNDFSMAYNAKTLVKRVQDLQDKSLDDDSVRRLYNLKDVSYWKLGAAREKLRGLRDLETYVKPYCYRPFDFRYVFYHEAVCERLRADAMRHMFHANIALLTHRPQSPGDFTFAYCTRLIGDQCVAANKTSGGGNSFQFPLYLYENGDLPATLFDHENGRRPNLAAAFIADVEKRLGMTFIPDGKGNLGIAKVAKRRGASAVTETTVGPEDVFQYLYAVFHAPSYRSRYAEFLKSDFPRLPLTSNVALFRSLVECGERLVVLHVMEAQPADNGVRYPVDGDHLVESVRYAATEVPNIGRVWINRKQYFDNMPQNVWEFHVGGYQVCEKWLKDRKGHLMSFDEIAHYLRITETIAETLDIMKRIDAVIEAAGGWPLEDGSSA
jgi:predicted helicase